MDNNNAPCYHISDKGKNKNFKNIKLITFDLDDTLWNVNALLDYADKECNEYMKKNYKKSYDYFLKTYELSMTKILIELLEKKVYMDNTSIQILAQIRTDALKHIASQSNCNEEEFTNAMQEVWQRKKNDVHLFISSGTLEYLRELKKRGYILGAITNGDSDVNQIKFLNEIFSFVIRSMDYNCEKPKADIFNIARNILKKKQNINIRPEEWLHVGDDIYTDVMGSKNARINCAWITMYRGGNEVNTDEWYSYLKLKLGNNKNSTLAQYDPYADSIFSKLRKRNVHLPYEYVDIEIRHCRDLDAILA
ncbi:haloacid dehalogenase-like hydrolase, putative [Plasmodium chabaudi chabaudi]|uniref:Haloacid dehalogenase-like hydrolase, putative n=1 Tax=Plasmodium chabaudi chabaudi TaxID=31271 RepID=A0A1C6YFI9_PLACU|nr:haloacid dehalogenase-like hydrolase, putative [Plasmodium chabaudi chabaudi]SCN60304.1 haloacid dehalogenase-like hydrolase, putative [Plasmodium chabaudi chabaudi]